jgi:hypothetical protein
MVSLKTPVCNTTKTAPGLPVHWLARASSPKYRAAPGRETRNRPREHGRSRHLKAGAAPDQWSNTFAQDWP